MKKKGYLFLALFCALTLLPVMALGATGLPDALWLSWNGGENGQMPDTAVRWFKNGDDYVLALPGSADLSSARVWFEGSQEELTLDGAAYRNGDPLAGLTDGATLTLKVGKKTNRTITVVKGSGIGSVFVRTESGKMSHVDRKKGNEEAGTILILNADGTEAYNGELKSIRMRGNTAVTLDKKNYNIKLKDGADLFGMGKEKKWALLGSHKDHSQIRNRIVYNMAAFAGLPYTPELVWVDLYLNHAYNGTYLLCERIEVDKDRVDIADLEKANEEVNEQPLDSYPMVGSEETRKGLYKAYRLDNDPADITGGYIIEYENYRLRYGDDPSAYTTRQGKVLVIKDPEICSVAEMEYISGFMQGYENAIFADDGIDPESGKHYTEFMDFQSLVSKYMLEEVCMNADGNGSSQYYFKPADSQSTVAFAGPCWDYDGTFACFSTTRGNMIDPKIFLHNKVNSSLYWWPQLYRKPDFYQGVRDTWKSTYSRALKILLGEDRDESGKLLSIDEYVAEIEKSVTMNFLRWPIEKSGMATNNKRTGKTFEANIEFLKKTIAERYEFLDSQWGQ